MKSDAGKCRFAVIPLSEDCGFIEWVPQTVTLRKVCEETYAAEGIFDKTSLATCKKILDNFTVSCWCLKPRRRASQYHQISLLSWRKASAPASRIDHSPHDASP